MKVNYQFVYSFCMSQLSTSKNRVPFHWTRICLLKYESNVWKPVHLITTGHPRTHFLSSNYTNKSGYLVKKYHINNIYPISYTLHHPILASKGNIVLNPSLALRGASEYPLWLLIAAKAGVYILEGNPARDNGSFCFLIVV